MMKTTTLSPYNLREGMILLMPSKPDYQNKFYVQEVSHNNDDTIIVRGSYVSFDAYPIASMIYYNHERVKIVLEE